VSIPRARRDENACPFGIADYLALEINFKLAKEHDAQMTLLAPVRLDKPPRELNKAQLLPLTMVSFESNSW